MSSRISMQNLSVNRRTFVAGTAGLGLMGALAGCSGGDEGAAGSGDAASGAFKLGGIGPTTGGAAIYGNACKNGAQIAIDEIAAAGGDVQFEMNFQDDENDAEKSVNAYKTSRTGACRCSWAPRPPRRAWP